MIPISLLGFKDFYWDTLAIIIHSSGNWIPPNSGHLGINTRLFSVTSHSVNCVLLKVFGWKTQRRAIHGQGEICVASDSLSLGASRYLR